MKAAQVRVLQSMVAAAALAATTVAAGPGPHAAPGASAPGASTEVLCHAQGNGTFAPLSVSVSAVPAHMAHGDGVPLGQGPDGLSVFTATCELVGNVAGTWLGESITFDPNFGCGRDRNLYRLTLQQSGSDVSGDVYWKILESFFPPDVGMEQTVPLTSGTVSGNTFTFSYGPPELGVVVSATFTGTTMTGSIALVGSSSCDPNTFELVRQ